MSTTSLTKHVDWELEYGVTEADIEATRARYAALSADTPEGYKAVSRALMEVRGTRTAIEKRRKELKAESLEYGRMVDGHAKRITELIAEIEEPLREKKAAIDDEKVRAEREAAEAALRAEEEKAAADRAELERFRAAEQARLQAEREAENARIEAERQAERERHRAENERLEAERAKIDAERKALEEAQRAERERQEAERRKLEKEQAELRAEQERIEREKLEREAKERAEREAAERAERERLAEIERQEAEAKRQAEEEARRRAVMSDAEVVREYAKRVEKVSSDLPVGLKSQDARNAVKDARTVIYNALKPLEAFGK